MDRVAWTIGIRRDTCSFTGSTEEEVYTFRRERDDRIRTTPPTVVRGDGWANTDNAKSRLTCIPNGGSRHQVLHVVRGDTLREPRGQLMRRPWCDNDEVP
jgi:hypothetical protein